MVESTYNGLDAHLAQQDLCSCFPLGEYYYMLYATLGPFALFTAMFWRTIINTHYQLSVTGNQISSVILLLCFICTSFQNEYDQFVKDDNCFLHSTDYDAAVQS